MVYECFFPIFNLPIVSDTRNCNDANILDGETVLILPHNYEELSVNHKQDIIYTICSQLENLSNGGENSLIKFKLDTGIETYELYIKKLEAEFDCETFYFTNGSFYLDFMAFIRIQTLI